MLGIIVCSTQNSEKEKQKQQVVWGDKKERIPRHDEGEDYNTSPSSLNPVTRDEI